MKYLYSLLLAPHRKTLEAFSNFIPDTCVGMMFYYVIL